MKKRYLWALLPLGLGIAASIGLNAGWVENPIFYVRADLGTWFLLLAIVVAILTGAGFALREWGARLQDGAQEAYQADRRRFLRRLDHELKNPLMAMRAGLANLAGSQGPGDRQVALDSLETQTLRISRLVTDLRKLAELETRPLERSQVDLTLLLEEVYSLAQEQPAAADRRLELSLPRAPWPLPAIVGDQDLLFLAVHNLLDNALKYSQPGNTIEMRASEDGATVVIEVADTGPGIPTDEQAHVWEELYRGQGARGTPGSGLGLSLVRAIIERHNGRVSLRSRSGQGTVISLLLPVHGKSS